LYSKWRGINRFPALTRSLDLLRQRPEVIARKVNVPLLAGVQKWIDRETRLGMPVLGKEVERTGDPDLKLAYDWSQAVNDAVDDMVHGVTPFPFVRESLEKLRPHADMIVCSATPTVALNKEWEEHDIARYVSAICGQEVGSKKESLGACQSKGYPADHVLMIGDAPGDMQAAKAVGALFYPINPGGEDASWRRFFEESCDKFLRSQYAGAYEAALIQEFDSYLPETPPWQR
jgi:phosphoglycolate phosphatase-like HAD superfamily hydrolase